MPEQLDEAGRLAWAASAIFAGRDCRARLAALKHWALNPPGGATARTTGGAAP